MENLQFFYDFEISKQGLLDCLNTISADKQANKTTYGDATCYYVQMGLASITLLENAFKGVIFNFQESSLEFVNSLNAEIFNRYSEKLISEKDYLTYLQMLGAYFGWCAVKKYKAYFATFENQKVLVLNNKAFNPALILKLCSEENKNVSLFFQNLC